MSKTETEHVPRYVSIYIKLYISKFLIIKLIDQQLVILHQLDF